MQRKIFLLLSKRLGEKAKMSERFSTKKTHACNNLRNIPTSHRKRHKKAYNRNVLKATIS